VSVLLVAGSTLSEAWALGLDALRQTTTGQRPHLLMNVSDPVAEVPGARAAVDAVLAARGEQSVETVAATIFPIDLYPVPPLGWAPDLVASDQQQLDQAAESLYTSYGDMLPTLLTASGSSNGTYFQRMISYPGPGPGGFNQLASRIDWIRSERRNQRKQGNYFNIDLAEDAAAPQPDRLDDLGGAGLQILRTEQRRPRGFPCLVHVDLTMEHDRLHVFALYRRQNLVTKAYGNLVGLAQLQAFLCQQTGLALGELSMMATFADSEGREIGKQRVAQLAGDVLDCVRRAQTSQSRDAEESEQQPPVEPVGRSAGSA
jgi:hypothetical protein